MNFSQDHVNWKLKAWGGALRTLVPGDRKVALGHRSPSLLPSYLSNAPGSSLDFFQESGDNKDKAGDGSFWTFAPGPPGQWGTIEALFDL